MKDAFQLLEEYKQRKEVKPVPLPEQFSPLFAQLAQMLERIAEKELPAQLVEVTQPDVQVTVDAPKVDVSVPEIKLPAPTVNIDNYDYTSILIELKRAVDKLKKTCVAMDGDIIGVDEDFLVLTPNYAKIWRGH